MTTVLAISQRTAGTDAVVVDGDGTVLGSAERTLRSRRLPDGARDQGPRDLLGSVIAAGRAAIAQAGLPVDVVALSHEAGRVLAWDLDSGRPLSNVMIRPDGRDAELRTTTRRLRHGVVTTTQSWLIHAMTGRFVTDAATADCSPYPGERLPEVVPCDAIVGSTIAFGGTSLVGGITVDQGASLLGGNCLRTAEAICTVDTPAVLVTNLGATATRSTARSPASLAWRVGGETSYYVDRSAPMAVAGVNWCKQLGYIGDVADIDAVAAPDALGVLAVPAVAEPGASWWRGDPTIGFSGTTRLTTVGHLITAILYGIAAEVADLGAAIGAELHQPLTRLRVDGRLACSRALLRCLADVMQIDVEVSPAARMAALGAAALGRIAVQPGVGLSDAVVAPKPGAIHRPRWTADRAAEFRGRWTAAARETSGRSGGRARPRWDRGADLRR